MYLRRIVGKTICVAALVMCFAERASAAENHATGEHTHQRKASRYQIIKAVGDGVVPSAVKLMSREDGVFFLNDFEQTKLHLQVAFGKRPAHCASSLMKLDDDGTYRSKEPLAPSQFVSMCFPFEGDYPFSFTTADGETRVYRGTVSVVRANQ